MSAPYRSWPKTRELKKIRDTQATLRWRNRTSPIYLGFTRPIRSQEGGLLRFCIDYRKLNDATVKDSYPIHRMDESIDSLGQAKVFTTLDAYSGYWQLPIKPEDRHKTAFSCNEGTCE